MGGVGEEKRGNRNCVGLKTLKYKKLPKESKLIVI